jgi:hypothetical protein
MARGAREPGGKLAGLIADYDRVVPASITALSSAFYRRTAPVM